MRMLSGTDCLLCGTTFSVLSGPVTLKMQWAVLWKLRLGCTVQDIPLKMVRTSSTHTSRKRRKGDANQNSYFAKRTFAQNSWPVLIMRVCDEATLTTTQAMLKPPTSALLGRPAMCRGSQDWISSKKTISLMCGLGTKMHFPAELSSLAERANMRAKV
eukprot:m.46628 g.46628  ORF g.46628 m.46628 type:complete len:158 (-) comp8785_c0_seq1:204-677(-)